MSHEQQHKEQEFSFKSLISPLTTFKAIHWIVFIGIVVYFNALFNGFVWDDKTYVLTNSQVYGTDIIKLFGPNIFNSLGFYRPIPALYFAVFYSIFGQTPFYYHFFQISLHVINAVLVFILFKSFFKKSLSFFLSLVFLVHPIQTESVIYIAQFDGILLFLLGMIAFLINRGVNTNKKQLLVTFFLLLFALLTKEASILFIGILLGFRFLLSKHKVLLYSVLSGGTLIVYAFIRFYLAHISIFRKPFNPISSLPLQERLLNIPQIIFYYIKTFFFPANLIIDQQWAIEKINLQNFYFPLLIESLISLVLLAFGFHLFRKNKASFKIYLFFVLWLVIGLGLHLQISPLDMTVADRWFYLPIVGALGIIGILIETFTPKISTNKKYLYVFFAIVLIVLSTRTVIRNSNWTNAITLYEHDSKLTNSFDLEGNLGQELYLTGQIDQALIHYQNSVQFLPFDRTYNNIATIYEHEGKYQLAKEYYIKAMNADDPIPPYRHTVQLYQNVSRLLFYYGDPNEAYTYINQGLSNYPNDFILLVLKGMVEFNLKENDKAVNSLNAAYAAAPYDNDRIIIQLVKNNPTKQLSFQDFYKLYYTPN